MRDSQLKKLAELSRISKDKLEQLYKVAEISAISEVKETILRWAIGWAAVLTVAFSAFAFLGIDRLISDAIREESEAIARAELAVEKHLSSMREKENEIDLIVRKFEPFIKDLQKIDKRDKFAAALTNLVLDLYVIKDIEAYIDVWFSTELQKLVDKPGDLAISIDLMRANRQLAQFAIDKDTMLTSSRRGTKYGLSYRLSPFHPDLTRLNGEPVGALRDVSLRFRKKPKDMTKFIDGYKSLERMVFRLAVNGIIIVKEELKELKFVTDDSHVYATHELPTLTDPDLAVDNAIAARVKDLKKKRDDLSS